MQSKSNGRQGLGGVPRRGIGRERTHARLKVQRPCFPSL